jgi:RNA polymerase sigma-70 factor (ECF subfamily)
MTDSVALLRQVLPLVLPRLRRFARTLTRHAHDADDLAQIAIERALQRAAQWRPPPTGATAEQIEGAVRSWMFGIVKNAWIDDLRSRKRERAVVRGDDAIEDVADDAHTAAEDRLSITAAMQRLPKEQRLSDALSGPGPGAAVTPIGAARRDAGRAARAAWSLREWSAVAATLAVGVLVGVFGSRGSGDLPFETRQGQLVAAAYLDTALSTQRSGAAPQDAAARIGMSFRAAGGEYCRTFALRTGASGLACRRDERWSLELLDGAATESAGADGFRQASSALSPAMLGAISALGAGDPLTPDEERQRLASGWDAASR